MDLPLQADPSAPAPTPTPDPTTAYNPYIADPTPRSRLIHINHYGRPRPLCAPVLAHAAILNFFARVDRLLGTSRFELADAADLTGGTDGPAPVAREVTEGEAVGHEGQSIGNQQVVIFRPRTSRPSVRLRPSPLILTQADPRDTSPIPRQNGPRSTMRIINASRDATIPTCRPGWPSRIGSVVLPGAGKVAL